MLMMVRRLLTFALAGAATIAHAQAAIARTDSILAPGVHYARWTDPRGPWMIHLVRIDRKRASVDLRVARAHDQLRSREKTSGMVQRAVDAGAMVLAAVNADFFDLKSGENENNQIIDGEWWKGLKVTESPYDTYDNTHAQFGLDGNGRPVLDRFIFDGVATVHGVATPVLTVNANPTGNPEGSALFTPRFGTNTPRDSTRVTAEVSLASAGRRADTLLFVRRGPLSTASGSAIPADGAVLTAYGARAKALESMADGDTVRMRFTSRPHLPRGAPLRLLIGGWPRILADGQNVAGDAATVEGTISRNAEVRNPRTAVGFSRDSSTLYLLTVDGRSQRSVGMTLTELADLLKSLGAWQALNFDGGGSTTMVIGGRVVNTTSDPTGEREVGNALLVVRRPAPRKR